MRSAVLESPPPLFLHSSSDVHADVCFSPYDTRVPPRKNNECKGHQRVGWEKEVSILPLFLALRVIPLDHAKMQSIYLLATLLTQASLESTISGRFQIDARDYPSTHTVPRFTNRVTGLVFKMVPEASKKRNDGGVGGVDCNLSFLVPPTSTNLWLTKGPLALPYFGPRSYSIKVHVSA